jgi:hypothetical protein
MRRPLASILLAAGLAACGPKSTGAPIGHRGGGTGGASLSVELVAGNTEDGMDATRTLAPAAGSHFPAASADGTTIVDLVQDAQDFSGIPIATVVFWTRAGVADKFQLVSEPAESEAVGQTQDEEATVAKINAKLAEYSWHPLDKVTATGESEDTGAPNLLDFGDGFTVTLDAVADKFPAPGTLPSDDGGGGCGEITGLTEGFGSRATGFAVVFPSANLGGDDCYGSPDADLAIVVAAPP